MMGEISGLRRGRIRKAVRGSSGAGEHEHGKLPKLCGCDSAGPVEMVRGLKCRAVLIPSAIRW